MVIAVSGKGGTGKSTLSALIVRYLVQMRKTPVLAVDVDPNDTLGDKLGVEASRTVGDMREQVLSQKYDAPSDTPKQRSVEYELQQAIVEGPGFDLLVMGRGEGPGCYCSINNMVKSFLHNVSSGYKNIVIDNEAGMEHLSRRTNDKVDLMLVVSDPTPTGLKAARRIAELAQKHGVVQGKIGFVINRADQAVNMDAITDTGLDILGYVPDDPLVKEYEQNSRSLLELPAESVAVNAVSVLMKAHAANI